MWDTLTLKTFICLLSEIEVYLCTLYFVWQPYVHHLKVTQRGVAVILV